MLDTIKHHWDCQSPPLSYDGEVSAKPKRKPGRPRKFSEDTQVFSLRLPVSLHEAIRKYVDDRGLSTNIVLLHAIEAWWRTVPERAQYDRAKRTRQAGAKRPS